MIWRRWKTAESHLLGKIWSLGFLAWIQLMLLGNALPLIESGLLFPSRAFAKRFLQGQFNSVPSLGEAVALVGIYGLATLMMILVLAYIITPSRDAQHRGLRRASKLGSAGLPWYSDAATSFWFVLAMALAGAFGWTVFAKELVGSHWFGMELSLARTFGVFFLVLAGSGLAFQAMLEAWGGRTVFLAIVFIGVVPAMTGTILAAASNDMTTAAVWLGGISPAAGPMYAAETLIPSNGSNLPLAVAKAVPKAFWFCQGVTLLVMLWLVSKLVEIKRKRRAVEPVS